MISMTIIVCGAFAAATVYDIELSYNDNFLARETSQSFLATADSISEVSFFCGRKIIPGNYKFRLTDSSGLVPITDWILSDSAGLYDYELVSASFNPKIYLRKGFKYRLLVSHNRDSLVNFYYNRDNPYPEGQLIGQPSNYDLAARIMGVNNFPKELFGMNSHLLMTYKNHPDSFYAMDKWAECIESMEAMGVTWDRVGVNAWQHFQLDSVDIDSFHYEWCDSLMKLYAKDSINVLWYFWMSTRWTACNSGWRKDSMVYYPFPENLYEPVLIDDTINPNNYFAQFVYKFIIRYGPSGVFWNSNPSLYYNPIRYYEMWNEPEWAIRDDWWGDSASLHPDFITDPVYADTIEDQGDTTSLITVYSRLCIVGDSAVQKAMTDSCPSDSVFTLVYLPYHHWADPPDSDFWPRPDDWLSVMASKNVDDACDGISMHSYATPTWQPKFHNRQKLTLDSLWIFLKDSDFRNKFLWCTEHSTGCYYACDSGVGLPVQTDEQLATLSSFSANDSPEGPLTHAFLWVFSHLYFNDTEKDSMRLKCITGDDFEKRPPGYGFDQLTAFLKDYQFNRCLVTGSTYDSIRVYEFENPQTNKRTYIGWKEWEISGDSVAYKLPMRTNAAKVEKTARNSNPETYTRSADACGWVNIALDTVPKFISEPTDSILRRPDLVIDSIWCDPPYPRDGDSVLVYAMLRNIDTVKATPDTVFADFYNNDTLFAVDTITAEIKPESTYVASLDSSWVAAQGIHLFKTVANPSKKFVEHDFTNNVQYRRYDVP